jgi:hypothetical protein
VELVAALACIQEAQLREEAEVKDGNAGNPLKIKFSSLPTQTFTEKAAAVCLAGVVVGYMASGAGDGRQ